MTNRRQFIQAAFGGATLVSLAHVVPPVLLGASARLSRSRGEHILVVIELGGGNDGLNTVVPYANDAYYENRFTLAVARNQVLRVDDAIGFHPALGGFAQLLEDQRLAVVQGVGYPNPNRSHFESMDLWYTAHRIEESRQLGWLGRCLDESPTLAGDLPAIHYGQEKQPLALANRTRPVATIASLEQFRLNTGGDTQIADAIRRDLGRPRTRDHALLDFIHDSARIAVQTSERLERVINDRGEAAGFPATRLGQKLAAVSQLIGSGLPTRIYYVTHNGFDTHSNQAEAHASLLRELGDATAALMTELAKQGNDSRTAIMTFSEFGRRVRENASRGTDHGTAAPLFVIGGGVRPGPINAHPDLNDLDQGDLKFSVDYRQVYASVLERWLEIDSHPILGGRFEPLDLFRSWRRGKQKSSRKGAKTQRRQDTRAP
jgi:uncharacterized protein (DUF1501 family)